MLTKKEIDLIEKVVVGGGATGASFTVDPVGAGNVALPGSNKNSDPMIKGQNPANIDIEETDDENNVKPTNVSSESNKSLNKSKPSAASVKQEDIDAIFSGDRRAHV